MSDAYYQELLKQTEIDLRKTLASDRKLGDKGPIRDVNKAKWLIGHLYMNYIQIANKLDDCYDQMIYPQKREVLGRLLDLTMGRLLELKSDIVRIEHDDYIFFDNVLIELKLTHQDLELKIPQYFWRDKEKIVQHRRELMKKVFEEAERMKFYHTFVKNIPEKERHSAWEKFLEEEKQKKIEKERLEEQQRKIIKLYVRDSHSQHRFRHRKKDKSEEEKTPEDVIEAIRLIQRHERARQGRIMAALETKNRYLKKLKEDETETVEGIANAAAKIIQSHWRRYQRRVRELKRKEHEKELLGLTLQSYRDSSRYKKNEATARARRALQEEAKKEYEEALVAMKDKVEALYTIPMEEDIVDEIRGWWMDFFEKTNFLPDYPPPKLVIPTGEMMGFPKNLSPEFLERAFGITPKKEGKEKEKGKGKGKAKKGGNLALALSGITAIGGTALTVAGLWLGPEEFLLCQNELNRMKDQKGGNKKKEKKTEKKPAKDEDSSDFRLAESNFIAPLLKAGRDIRLHWMDIDENKSSERKYVPEYMKNDLCMELSMKVRKVVDEMMELELEILKDALQRDKFPKKKKRKKKKKPKNKKKRKKREKPDPTAHKTMDELFIELYRNGIIRKYEDAHLKDYQGERSFGAFDMRERLVDWPPSSGDVRDLIIQLCILPLGSWRIRQLVPLVKSVCLIGTENSGKEFLARIICTETAAVMFDLSPENVFEKYPGKANQKMLEHLIGKMSRALQPSVIFVNGAEKTFYKRVPKDQKDLEPRRMAGIISKFVKGIKPPDQVLLLGVSSFPWMAKRQKFSKIYQKIIMVPQVDYCTYVRLWQTLLMAYHSVPRDFDVACLAKVSAGFSVKSIMDAVTNVMTVTRISNSGVKPYQAIEFLEELLKTKPTDQKQKNKCIKFYDRTGLRRKRAKMLKEMRELREGKQRASNIK